MRIDQPIQTATSPIPPDEKTTREISSLLSKIDGGGTWEAILQQDMRIQLKTAQALRLSNLEIRRRVVQDLVKKMEQAANFRLGSALLGAGAAIGSAWIGVKLEKAENALVRNFLPKVTEALSRVVASVNPMESRALTCDQAAKRLEQRGAELAEDGKSTADWIQSARELEGRLLSRMEEIERVEHEIRLCSKKGSLAS
jgi:hypothetical protein